MYYNNAAAPAGEVDVVAPRRAMLPPSSTSLSGHHHAHYQYAPPPPPPPMRSPPSTHHHVGAFTHHPRPLDMRHPPPPPPPQSHHAQHYRPAAPAAAEPDFYKRHQHFAHPPPRGIEYGAGREYPVQHHVMSSHGAQEMPPPPFDYHNGRMTYFDPYYGNSQHDLPPYADHRQMMLNKELIVNVAPGFAEKPMDQRPTYVGYIKSAHDAILLLSACDVPFDATSSCGGSIPPPRRVSRRLLDAERADMVASGCVFAWDEKEAGMKRWTDGRVWSASRVSGCFLTYRELEARKKSSSNPHDGPTSNQYKPEGLIKQSFSVTTASGRKLHVISYFTKRDVREGRLRRVSEDPRFVGEGGGEWDLKVDDEEYSFPDGNHRPQGQQSGEGSSHSLSDLENDDEILNEPLTLQHNPRKRSVPDETDVDREATLKRPPPRPKLTRLRSSSLSNSASSSAFKSFSKESTSSATTSVPSSSDGRLAVKKLPAATGSATVRSLVSPTLPRESAIRGSACDMQPTQSQDNANAVGALLSLAGRKESIAPSPLSAAAAAAATQASSARPLPERRDSDQNALNQFSVRL